MLFFFLSLSLFFFFFSSNRLSGDLVFPDSLFSPGDFQVIPPSDNKLFMERQNTPSEGMETLPSATGGSGYFPVQLIKH